VTSLEEALRQIHTHLTDVHVPFALVGGLAVSARTEPRFTRDADAISVCGAVQASRSASVGLILSARLAGTIEASIAATSITPVVAARKPA